MSFRSRLGVILIVLGLVSLFLPFTREFAIISVFLVIYGVTSIVRSIGGKYRLRGLFGPLRRSSPHAQVRSSPRIDPLLPVRVLKLAESRSGQLTVSSVAMALNVGLDECQLALDELVRKGAANVDVDLSTGVASYRFPEFLPRGEESEGI